MKSNQLKFQILTTAGFTLGLALIMSENSILRFMARRYQPSEQVGSVFNLEGQALRRYHRDLLWVPLENGNPIFNNDVLYSGPQSELKINLSPSSFMRLHGDTLVRVRRSGPGSFVEIEKGQMSLSSQNHDQILIRENQVTRSVSLDPSEKSFTSNSPGKPPELFAPDQSEKGEGPEFSLNSDGESLEPQTENAAPEAASEKPDAALNESSEENKLNWFDPKVLAFVGIYVFIMILSLLDGYRSRSK